MKSSKPYKIIPRRFRPKNFSEVVGQDAIVTTLKNALSYQKIGQAYLFSGTRGCGKTTLARLFAKALNCIQLTQDFEPCNHCTRCIEISEGQTFDIIEIDGASNRGIDDIRKLTETIGYAPQTSKYKIYLIDEVHMLTKEAFNALLKTLEEPPEAVKFFFATTEPHRIPPTIISRCQRFNLIRIPVKIVVQKLKTIADQLHIEAEESALLHIGKLAEGSLRDAESLLDQLICFGRTPITEDLTRDLFGLLSHDHLEQIDRAIENTDVQKALAVGKSLYNSGRDIEACIDHLLEHYRDHLLELKRFNKTQCLNILETLIEWQQRFSKTPFKQVHLEMCLAALVKNSQHLSLDTLIERLLQLEESSHQINNDLSHPTQQPVSTKLPPEPVSEKRSFEKLNNTGDFTDSSDSNTPINHSAFEQSKSKDLPVLKNQNFEDKQKHPASKYETLIRFASVELEGSIKNG